MSKHLSDFERKFDTAIDEIQTDAMTMLERVAWQFIAKFPGKAIRFEDCMGCVGWEIRDYKSKFSKASRTENGRHLIMLEDVKSLYTTSVWATDKTRAAYKSIFSELDEIQSYILSDRFFDSVSLRTGWIEGGQC